MPGPFNYFASANDKVETNNLEIERTNWKGMAASQNLSGIEKYGNSFAMRKWDPISCTHLFKLLEA